MVELNCRVGVTLDLRSPVYRDDDPPSPVRVYNIDFGFGCMKGEEEKEEEEEEEKAAANRGG